MGALEIIKIAALSCACAAAVVALVLFCIVRIVRRREEQEDDEEDGDGLEWIDVSGAEAVSRRGAGAVYLAFTREESGRETEMILPARKIEYVAKRPNGRAYIGCYKIELKSGFYYAGYDTAESYEEIVRRLTGDVAEIPENGDEGERSEEARARRNP